MCTRKQQPRQSLERSSDSGNGATQQPEVQQALEQLDRWAFDIFVLHALVKGRTLEVVSLALLQRLGLIEELQLPPAKVCSFLRAVTRAYRSNPYHSALHAADVVQTLGSIILQVSVGAALLS